MNFEAEIALLQASFYCESETSSRSYSHSQSQSKTPVPNQRNFTNVNVIAVCHAVKEIIHGLETDRSEVEKHLWNFKLHAILFCKLLESKKGECGTEKSSQSSSVKSEDDDCWLRYFDGVSRALPDCIDLSLYLDLVNSLQWGSLCAKVLSSLDYKVSQVLLVDITAECITEGYIDLLIGILTGLLAPSSCNSSTRSELVFCGNNLQSHIRTKLSIYALVANASYHRLIVLSCDQILTVSLELEDRNQRLSMIQAMMVSLNSLILDLHTSEVDHGSKAHFIDKLEHSQSSLEVKLLPHKYSWNDDQNYSIEIYNLHLLSSSHHEDCIRVMEQDKTLLHRESQRYSGTLEASSECREYLLQAVARLLFTLHGLLMKDWTNLFSGVRDSNTEPGAGASLKYDNAAQNVPLIKNISHALHRLVQCLGQVSAVPLQDAVIDIKSVEQQSNELMAYLSGVLDETESIDNSMTLAESLPVAVEMDEVTNAERGHIWLQKAISRVDARLEGYEDDLGQLLSSSDQWEDDTWIECLERNAATLALPGFVKRLIDVAMAMDKQETDEALLHRVLKVLLASFSSLPLLLQNQLRDYLWSFPAGVTIFVRCHVCNFDQESTSAFNRLVTLAQGQENVEVLTALSCMALQSPSQTLQQAVSRAVSNAAMCQAVCQVLQAMPSLATFKPQANGWPLLCHLIEEATRTLATSASEEANLVQLVTTLLQPYKPLLDPHCLFWIPPVLSAHGVIRVCVLPHISTNTVETSHQSQLMMALKFLGEVLNFQELWTQDGDSSIFGPLTFPIMLCLCELLDTCHVLWDGAAVTMQKAEVKEVVLGLLGRMGRMVMAVYNDENTERGMSWLINRVSTSLHWTTALILKELMPDCLLHLERLVPECIFDICSLPDSAWSSIPSSGSHHRSTSVCDKLTELLLCCRISDSLAACLSQTLQVAKGTSHRSLQQALTLALVQVLPQCIMGEWQCIMGMLKQLLANEVLVVPCSACYMIELPILNIADFRVHLSISQLLLSVMQLLMSPCCQDWASPQLLHHMTRCHVNTMQKLISDMLNSDLRNAPGCLFVMGQLFCHTCEVISFLQTEDLKEQVFVLTLDILSRMQVITTSISNRVLDFDWTSHRAVLQVMSNQKLAGDQRKTLLQKIGDFK